MAVYIKNVTGVPQTWVGAQIAPSTYNLIEIEELSKWKTDSDLLDAISAGDAVVATSNDGLGDLSAQDGIDVLGDSIQGNPDISLALTGENGLPFTQVISSEYVTVAMIPYQGSNLEGTIKSVQILARLQPTGETGSVRLQDTDNNVTLAEGIDIIDDTAGPFAVYDLGPVSNVPLNPQIIKLQVKSDGGVKKFKIGYVRLKK